MDRRAESGAPQRSKIGVAEVDRVIDGMMLARVVDPGQVPMYQQVRIDSPEMSLVLAVLEDALRSLLRSRTPTTRAQRRELAEDIAWIDSDDDSHAFAFVPVCQRLRIDPEWIRRLVRTRRAVRSVLQAEAA